jgi:hypothetical protein
VIEVLQAVYYLAAILNELIRLVERIIKKAREEEEDFIIRL